MFEELLRRLLVVRAPEQPGRYRTRMAETVRLLARLRQLFSKHADGAWSTAPRLVADFRLAIQSRRYPIRDLDVEAALAALQEALSGLDPDLERALRTVLANRGADFALASFQVDAAAAILRACATRVAGQRWSPRGQAAAKRSPSTCRFCPPLQQRGSSRPAGIGHLSQERTTEGPVVSDLYRGASPGWRMTGRPPR